MQTFSFSCFTVLLLAGLSWEVHSSTEPTQRLFSNHNAATVPFEVKRLNNGQPIISKWTFDDAGDSPSSHEAHSINGPSLIRVPSWVKDKADPSAVYYCYFGHHQGKYIRMAWAETLEGPWTLFNQHNYTNTRYPGRGVLDMVGPEPVPINFTNGDFINVNKGHHVASPYVIVDDLCQRILLFFHVCGHSRARGTDWFDTGTQRTMVATSRSGLNFNGGKYVMAGGAGPAEEGTDGTGEGFGIKNVLLGNAYFSVFTHKKRYFAFSNYGPLWAGPSSEDAETPVQPWENMWETVAWKRNTKQLLGGGNPVWMNLHERYLDSKGTEPLPPRYKAGSARPNKGAPRHFATRLQRDGETLEVYYTSRGDKPERIFRTTMTLNESLHFSEWKTLTSGTPDIHDEVLRPAEVWEGSEHAASFSTNGAATDENALRDPFLFTDIDGLSYILYSGNPESAIGIASLNNLPTATLHLSEIDRTTVSVFYKSLDTDGKIEQLVWDWGDGSIESTTIDDDPSDGESTSGNEAHTYKHNGRYNITLTVRDNAGGTFSALTTVQVLGQTTGESSRILVNLLILGSPTLLLLLVCIIFCKFQYCTGSMVMNVSNDSDEALPLRDRALD